MKLGLPGIREMLNRIQKRIKNVMRVMHPMRLIQAVTLPKKGGCILGAKKFNLPRFAEKLIIQGRKGKRLNCLK